mmetsp:Transcript_16703/g.31277  ORF Transcript_16703/g.31277 Transcript_16703/m.31277 type:complete len:218 (+) Transcript_16703:5083-5736(+)
MCLRRQRRNVIPPLRLRHGPPKNHARSRCDLHLRREALRPLLLLHRPTKFPLQNSRLGPLNKFPRSRPIFPDNDHLRLHFPPPMVARRRSNGCHPLRNDNGKRLKIEHPLDKKIQPRGVAFQRRHNPNRVEDKQTNKKANPKRIRLRRFPREAGQRQINLRKQVLQKTLLHPKKHHPPILRRERRELEVKTRKGSAITRRRHHNSLKRRGVLHRIVR